MGEPQHRSGTRTGPQVLIVTADPGVRGLLATYLQECGCHVTVSTNVAVVEDFINTGSVDVLVLDRMLPNDNGLVVCRRLREAGSGVALIMFSAHNCEQDRVTALDAGADDYLTWPFGGRELLARIRALLRRCRTVLPVPPVFEHSGPAGRRNAPAQRLIQEHASLGNNTQDVQSACPSAASICAEQPGALSPLLAGFPGAPDGGNRQ